MKFEYDQTLMYKRPATNYGIQFETLKSLAKDPLRLQRKDFEVVHPDQVLDSWGCIPEKPIHAVIPEIMGNIKPEIYRYEPSGLRGFLEMLLPPYTSENQDIRD